MAGSGPCRRLGQYHLLRSPGTTPRIANRSWCWHDPPTRGRTFNNYAWTDEAFEAGGLFSSVITTDWRRMVGESMASGRRSPFHRLLPMRKAKSEEVKDLKTARTRGTVVKLGTADFTGKRWQAVQRRVSEQLSHAVESASVPTGSERGIARSPAASSQSVLNSSSTAPFASSKRICIASKPEAWVEQLRHGS